MTITRSAIILGGALVLMLIVIVLRTEAVRIHYRISQLDQQADALTQDLREAELELQRLRSPAVIRSKAAELSQLVIDPAAASAPPAEKKKKP